MSESRGFPAELLSFLLFGALGVAVTAAALAGFVSAFRGAGGGRNSGGAGRFCAADGRAGLLRQRSADTCHNSRMHGQFAVCTGGSVP